MHQQLRETEIDCSDRNFIAFLDEEIASPHERRLRLRVVHQFELSNPLHREAKTRFIPVPKLLKYFKCSRGYGRSVLEQVEL